MNLFKWSTTAASNNSAVPDGAPEGWLGQNVNDVVRELMARAREQASDAAYIDETYQLSAVGTKSLTKNSTTQFQINSCDATAHFTTDRRIKVVGNTTDFGFVTSSSFSTNTIVNVTMDSGDVPVAPTQALVHVDSKIRNSAYLKTGTGSGLDADKVDGYHAADIFGPSIFAEALINGAMLVWQRGTSGSCPPATRTYHADRWWTNPTTAAVSCAQTTVTPTGAVSRYAKLITGAATVGVCEIAGQRIESYLIPYIKTTVTFSCLVKNDTTASLTISLLLGTPTVTDNFASVTNRLTQAMTAIPSGNSQRLSYTVAINGYTDIDKGLEVKWQSPAGALDSGVKSITITEIQIDRSSAFSFFSYRSLADETSRCQRYYQKTFAYETTPAQNWVGAGSGIPAGALVMPGSSSGASPNSGVTWTFPVPMRATPTATTYNPRVANANAVELDGSGDNTLTVTASTSGISFASAVATQASCFGATAESEL